MSSFFFLLFIPVFIFCGVPKVFANNGEGNNIQGLSCIEVFIALHGSIRSTVSTHLFLEEGWISERTTLMGGGKPYTKYSPEEYAAENKILWASKKPSSLTQNLFQLHLILGEKAATPEEKEKRKTELKEIIKYMTGFSFRFDQIAEIYGKDRSSKLRAAIRHEMAERTILFLSAQGVKIDVSKDENGFLSAQILPEGDHVLNKRAAQIQTQKKYYGLTFHYKVMANIRAAYLGYYSHLYLSSDEILALRPKGPVINHELLHADNYDDEERDFGRASALDGTRLPMDFLGATDLHHFEEAENFSYTIRSSAQEILEQYLKNDMDDIQYKEVTLLNDVFQATLMNKANIIISNLLDKAFEDKVKPKITRVRVREKGPHHEIYREGIVIPLNYDEQTFNYEMIIHDRSLKKTEEKIAYVRRKVDHMLKLNPNYKAQFDVAMQAMEKFLHVAKSPREKAAILEGIISITRPHFWTEGKFKVVTEKELIERFNNVFYERWLKFEYMAGH